jgi:hypothetical protein
MADTVAMPDTESTHAPTDTEDEGHGHVPAGGSLGPVDVAAWAFAGAGAVMGALVVLALLIARGG